MIYIGIDPGTKTGIAVWDAVRKKLVEVETVPIHKAMDMVRAYKAATDASGVGLRVIFEDARQRKWFDHNATARIQGAGSIKRDCSIWDDYLQDMGILYQALPPGKNMTKWSESYFKTVTGWKGRTSNHARDAAVLVFGR